MTLSVMHQDLSGKSPLLLLGIDMKRGTALLERGEKEVFDFERITNRSLARRITQDLLEYNKVSCRPRDIIRRPHFSLRKNGELVGWIGCRRHRSYIYEIKHLTVLPQFQRQRVGKSAVEFIMEELRKRYVSLCYCYIRQENRASRKLFESLGFEVRRKGKLMTYARGLF